MNPIRVVETIIDWIFNRDEYSNFGKTGERLTYNTLCEIYRKKQIFRNLYIKRSNGRYTEIDLCTVGRGTIFVYESKNLRGEISTDIKNNWYQKPPDKRKIKIDSPILQNDVHVEALKEYLSGYPLDFHSVIVFNEYSNIDNIKCNFPGVHFIKCDKLANYIYKIRRKANLCITKKQLHEVIELLGKAERPDDSVKQQHLDDLKTAKTTCPWCGKRLVERTSSETGLRFLGCIGFKGYPRCKYTRSIRS